MGTDNGTLEDVNQCKVKEYSHVAIGHRTSGTKLHVISKLGKTIGVAKCGEIVLLGAKHSWVKAFTKKDYESMRIAGMVCGRCARGYLKKK